jgi:hypothetical protein
MCFEKSSENYLNARTMASTDAPTHLIQDIGNTWVIADKSYDRNAFVEKFGKKDYTPVILTENILEITTNISIRNATLLIMCAPISRKKAVDLALLL